MFLESLFHWNEGELPIVPQAEPGILGISGETMYHGTNGHVRNLETTFANEVGLKNRTD